ncbi:biosynthetic-type acetolactate synthase large subunit [Pseudomaricurvus alkylphenolicus]|jgi:acetolactate synthase-1/2/3 large subunit|uniref:biosynthetic-type acetolactate synthase large subunit n=1 Tax=Pseudomaricurvus alkylphenolicus TaxID=1306991 RepID=UPI00197DDCD5|nr:biosynthetic-type acetolactate synthase large subunit [Pseudomaricurvus alkylphenolicus]
MTNIPHHNEDNITYQNRGTISGGDLEDIKATQRHLALRGAQILAKALQAEGVDTLFGYPGGANLEIFDVLREYNIRCIRTEHEQGAIHAAQGFARATGKVGVCLATSGPGATNLVTGIADANSDSTPIVAITGNVPSHLLGRNAFQEVDIVGVTRPITKKNYLVKKVTDIPEVVREAFALAGGNRPGPVLVDIPKDIQQHYPRDPEGNYAPPRIPAVIEKPEPGIGGIPETQLEEACRLLSEASKPVIYAGGGIVSANAANELLALAEKLQCPVTTTLMGVGAFPPHHDLALHVLGMHGSKYANTAINEADLVIAAGVRFDDRVTGNLNEFIRHGKIIHIDIDRNELNKNKVVTLPICADIKPALVQLRENAQPGEYRVWRDYLADLRERYPFKVPDSDSITPQYAISQLSQITQGDAIVSLGVGQHQMWAMQHYRARRSRSFLSSSGFGTMGYGLPAAIGAKIGCPERTVIDIDGDGSLNMTIHELAACHRYGIGVKVVVMNNQWLGMVRQWQDMIYDKHRSGSDQSDPTAVKKPEDLEIYPNFLKIAEGYRVKAERVTCKEELLAAYQRLLADPDEPYLLDVIVEAEENVYPMIPAGGSYRDIIMGESVT